MVCPAGRWKEHTSIDRLRTLLTSAFMLYDVASSLLSASTSFFGVLAAGRRRTRRGGGLHMSVPDGPPCTMELCTPPAPCPFGPAVTCHRPSHVDKMVSCPVPSNESLLPAGCACTCVPKSKSGRAWHRGASPQALGILGAEGKGRKGEVQSPTVFFLAAVFLELTD